MEHSFSFLKFYKKVTSHWELIEKPYLVKINNLVFVGMKISFHNPYVLSVQYTWMEFAVFAHL